MIRSIHLSSMPAPVRSHSGPAARCSPFRRAGPVPRRCCRPVRALRAAPPRLSCPTSSPAARCTVGPRPRSHFPASDRLADEAAERVLHDTERPLDTLPQQPSVRQLRFEVAHRIVQTRHIGQHPHSYRHKPLVLRGCMFIQAVRLISCASLYDIVIMFYVFCCCAP